MSDTPAPQERTSASPPWLYALWFLGGILITVLFFVLYSLLTKPAEVALPNYAQPETLLRLQDATNQGLQEEIDRLKRFLERDVCLIGESTLLPRGLPLLPTPDDAPGSAPPASQPDTLKIPGAGTTPEGTQVPDARTSAPPKTIAQHLEQATVLVVSPGEQGVSFGTGFFFAPGLIATNRHVIANNSDGRLFVTNKMLGGVIAGTIQAISTDINRDYAIIKVDDPRASSIHPLSFTLSVERTERVSAWGYPGLLMENDPKYQALLRGDASATPEVTYSEGVVSVVLQRSPPLVVHTADLSQGNSGGPLVNQNGQVVAINTLIQFNAESNRQVSVSLESSDLASFIKASNLPLSVAP